MRSPLVLAMVAFAFVGCRQYLARHAWEPLFPTDGAPSGWVVRAWNDVSKPGPSDAVWTVQNGVLSSSGERGCWLMSEKEYGDFELEFEFKLGERGNSGLALRAPMAGDPAFDGMELQMADFRYNPEAKPSELTGGIYRAIEPRKQVYRPTEWNHYEVSLRGTHLRARLNGVLIHDLDLAEQNIVVKRHDDSNAPAVKDRPRRGHIGFQELSRDNAHVMIRNAFIREVTPKSLSDNRPDTAKRTGRKSVWSGMTLPIGCLDFLVQSDHRHSISGITRIIRRCVRFSLPFSAQFPVKRARLWDEL